MEDQSDIGLYLFHMAATWLKTTNFGMKSVCSVILPRVSLNEKRRVDHGLNNFEASLCQSKINRLIVQGKDGHSPETDSRPVEFIYVQ